MRSPLALVVLGALVLVLAAPAGASSHRSTRLRGLAGAVLTQMNSVRRAHGLAPLRASTQLTAAAASHSGEMAHVGYFSHSSADGSSFWRRVLRFYPRNGSRYWAVGENLLWSSPDISSTGAIRMWMQSPEHRANLLSRRWREVGISTVHVSSAPGVFGGGAVTVVTADFGVRR
jgi:uncharacterized protein YkwD